MAFNAIIVLIYLAFVIMIIINHTRTVKRIRSNYEELYNNQLAIFKTTLKVQERECSELLEVRAKQFKMVKNEYSKLFEAYKDAPALTYKLDIVAIKEELKLLNGRVKTVEEADRIDVLNGALKYAEERLNNEQKRES